MGYMSLFPIALSIIIHFFHYNSFAYEFASTVTVERNGKGQFKTIQAAINHVPSGNNKWFRIIIYAGLYMERVSIPADKEYIFLQGSNRSKPIISSNVHTSSVDATFSCSANNFVAKNIKFLNSYNKKQKDSVTQAPAAIIYGDKSAFYNCEFIGYQDTLADTTGRHYYKSCYIEGGVDFIWGSGQSVFEGCKIRTTVEPNYRSYITAQGRNSTNDPSGFVFLKCDIGGTGQAYLGRAYGAHSRVVLIESTLSSLVIPEGWDAWMYQGHEDDFTYLEAGCQGKGANSPKRVSWAKIMHSKSAGLEQFSTQNFINKDGWLAKTNFY